MTAGPGQQTIVLIDRAGRLQSLERPQAAYREPRISANGKRLAVGTDDGKEAIEWVYELDGASAIRRLTLGGRSRYPVWSGRSLNHRLTGAFHASAIGRLVAAHSARAEPTDDAELPEAVADRPGF